VLVAAQREWARAGEVHTEEGAILVSEAGAVILVEIAVAVRAGKDTQSKRLLGE
jgi:hypothetical protein